MLAAAQSTASAAVVAVVIVGLAFAEGGFFAQSWGWSALALLLTAFVGLTLASRVELTALEIGALSAMLGLVVWTLLSGFWSPGFTLPVAAAERLLVYAATLLVCICATRRTNRSTLAIGVWAALVVVCVYSLGTRLVPERWGFFVDAAAHGRLFQPVGYWNGLGVMAAIAFLLGLGLAMRSSSAVLRLTAAASLPITASVLYLTFSRGSELGLVVGLAVLIAVDPNRLATFTRIVALAVPSLLCLAAAARSHGLTTPNQKLHHAAHAGHRYLAVLIVVMAVSAGVAAWLWAQREFQPSPALLRAYKAALAVAAVLILAGFVVSFGAPWSWPHKVYVQTGTVTDTPDVTNLNQRLGSASLSGRGPLWHGALHEFQSHPLAGGGAGSFGAYWAQHQTSDLNSVNAHSLYLETLAELGVVGLILLVVLFGCMIAGGVRGRAGPQVPFALAAVVAYAVAASTDWDWQMAAVTVPMLVCGATILGGRVRVALRPGPGRVVLMAAVAAAMVCAGAGLMGNVWLDRSYAALRAGDAQQAVSDAGRANSWMPWSSEPLAQRARAQVIAGQPAAAVQSIDAALDRSPDDWSLWLLKARITTGAVSRDARARAIVLKPTLVQLLNHTRTS